MAGRRGVSWLVAGGFQSLGDQLRITARIVDVDTGTTRATVKVDGRMDEVFALQDRIVVELAPGFVSLLGETPSPVASTSESEAVVLTGRQTPTTEGEGVRPDTQGALGPLGGGRSTRAAGRGGQLDPDVGTTRSAAELPEGLTSSSRGRRADGSAPAGDVTGRLGIGGAPARLAAAGEAGALTGRVNVRPSRTSTPPTVDGRLDDAVWQDAAGITDFIQQQPLDGAPASEKSDVYIAYDSTNIYLAFHAHYEDPSIMRANRSDRDQAGRSDDVFSVYFDPFS